LIDMHQSIIQVPYHIGRRGTGTALGPSRLTGSGPGCARPDERVETVEVDVPRHVAELDGEAGDLARLALVNSDLARRVERATRAGRLPVVLAGDCNAAVGVLGGLAMAGASRPATIWFDAHGDVNTPESSVTGFIDGMALATALGRCHDDMRRAAGLEPPQPVSHTMLAGVRDLDPAERDWIASSGMAAVDAEAMIAHGAAAMDAALARMQELAEAAYVHLDLDVLDPSVASGAGYRVPGGLDERTLADALARIRRRFRIAAVAITNLDPARDEGDRTARVALRLLRGLVA
jgi:arginase